MKDLDFLLYGLLGVGLLAIVALELGQAVWASGSVMLRALFVFGAAGTIASVIVDLRRRKVGPVSAILVGAWILSVVIVLMAELVA